MAGGLGLEAGELGGGVEDDLVGIGERLVDLVVGPGDGVGVGLAGEFRAAELDLEERAGGGAVHVLGHDVEDRPGGEAFERQQGLGAGGLAQPRDLLEVRQQAGFVDQVIGRLHLDLGRFGVEGNGPYRESGGMRQVAAR